MTTNQLFSIALVVLSAALGLLTWAVKRQIGHNDDNAAKLAKIDRDLSKLDGVPTIVNEHTLALAQLSSSVAVLTTGHSQTLDTVEDLDDAVQALQIATAVFRDRLEAHEHFRAELERNKPRGDRP